MINIAIVEDDKNYKEVLKNYIQRMEIEQNQHFCIHYFEDGEDIAIDYKGNYDIIIMDIEMQFMDGMTAAEEIRKVDNEVVIIFITNMPQYAMKGYAVEALDYVIKPLNYFAFSQRIERAINRIKKRTKKYITISNKNSIRKIDIDEINYVEVQNHDLIYHTKNSQYIERGTMKNLEGMLAKEGFFRCNKCYLINLEKVEGCEDNYVLVNGEKVQVSRARKKELLDVLNDYMNEVSK